jgi:hypothetical protein
MKQLHPSLLLAAAIAFCTNSALAQGTLLYTWHGNQNLFQASFEIYDFEQTPGTYFSGTGLFDRTITVASPDHTWPPTPGIGTADNEYVSGYRGSFPYALFLDAVLGDSSLPNVRVFVFASGIDEQNWIGGSPTGSRYGESGYWTFAPVPEPSCAALVVLGLLTLIRKKASSLP